MTGHRWGICAAVLATLGAASLGEPSRFIVLGDLPGGLCGSQVRSISHDGTAVVGTSASFLGSEAFLWTMDTGLTGLGFPSGDFDSSFAIAVSNGGSVVVGSTYRGSYPEAFRWDPINGMSLLGDLPGGELNSEAMDVSAGGAVIVGYSGSSSGGEAFYWTETTEMVPLGDLPDGKFWSSARAVSSDGSVLAGMGSTSFGYEAFRWTSAAGLKPLGELPGGDYYSAARAISANGEIVVGYSKSTTGLYAYSGGEAFRWTEPEGMVGLGDLPGGDYYSMAEDVSADGAIIVGWGVSETGQKAVIWGPGGMRTVRDVLVEDFAVDLTGWRLLEATGVSDDGFTICGTGLDPDGNRLGWVAIVPEPGTLALLLWAAVLARKRRTQHA